MWYMVHRLPFHQWVHGAGSAMVSYACGALIGRPPLTQPVATGYAASERREHA
jgi:hypothetical protein